ncbi:MAG: extracellular solute-binding protein, partial [Candidatus Ornithospirochaeta sp.]
RYQLPLYYETLLFMYNKKYMKESEVPSTTEELYSYMEKKTKYGHYGFVEQHSTPYYAAGWLHAFGVDWIDVDGNPLLDDERTIRALEYHKKFVALMPGETEYATVNTLFSEGMAHSTIAGPWFIPTVIKKGIDVGFAPMPLVEETGERINPYCGVQGLHVLKTASGKKDAIKKVLEALLDGEVQISLALSTGCAPAGIECYEDERIKGNSLVNAMRETAENAVAMSNRPEMDVMFTVSSSLLTDVNMSGKDVMTSAAAAQKKALELLEAMK